MSMQFRYTARIYEVSVQIVLFEVEFLTVWSHEPEALLITAKLDCFAHLRTEFVRVVVESSIKEARQEDLFPTLKTEAEIYGLKRAAFLGAGKLHILFYE